jgi:hypothetical protein
MCITLPIKTILDTDIGTDIDDTWALFFILSKPSVFDLRLIQVSTFNTTKRAQITAMILDNLGKYDVPIALGRYTGENIMPQYDSRVANYSLLDFEKKGGKVLEGTEKYAELMNKASEDDPVLIVEIAPATSVGDVLRQYPEASRNCYCFAMSGSINRGYWNSSTPSAESNVHSDIYSSMLMYNASWLSPLVIAPLDTGIAMQYFGAPFETLLLVNNTAHISAYVLLEEAKTWYFGGGKGFGAYFPYTPFNGTSTLWDLQASYLAYSAMRLGNPYPTSFPYFSVELLPIMVTNDGYTIVSTAAKQMVGAAIKYATIWESDVINVEVDTVSSIISLST